MIPRKLELKNFLSYGEPTQVIDFNDHGLICLSGKNGHGKSALLDAVTWAVWGQARKTSGTSKAADGLLKLGQTRMLVSLEFEFNARQYRVRREYAKTYGKPYAALDFDIYDDEKKRFVSLTDKTIRATQTKIETLIGLDFETFSNSAFLRQGQSNEFSKKSPRERKQILANILGLDRFDKLAQAANEKNRSLSDEKKILTMLRERHQETLDKEKDLTKAHQEKQEALKKSKNDLLKLNKNILTLEKKKLTLEQQEQEVIQLTKEESQITDEKTKTLSEFTTLVKAWKNCHRKLLSLPHLDKLETEKHVLQKKEKDFYLLQEKTLTLEKQSLTLQNTIQTRFTELKNQYDQTINQKKLNLDRQALEEKHYKQKLEEKEIQLKRLGESKKETIKSLEQLQKKKQEHGLFEVKLEADKLHFDKRRTFYQTLVQKGNWIKQQQKDLEHKKRIIQDQTNPSCPLCEQVLTISRKQFLSSHFAKDEQFLHHRLSRITDLLKKLKKILVTQHKQLEEKAKQQKDFLSIDASIKELESSQTKIETEFNLQKNDFEKLTSDYKKLTRTITGAQEIFAQEQKTLLTSLEKDDELIRLKSSLDLIKKEQTTISFDEQLGKKIQDQIKKIEQELEFSSKQKALLAEQVKRKNMIAMLNLETKQLKKKLLLLSKKLAGYADLSKIQTITNQTLTSLKKEHEELTLSQEKLFKETNSLALELDQLTKIKKEVAESNKKVKTLDEKIDDFSVLSQTFGKNGIQALLIEEAVPEIEKEANNMLARLTDNQSQVFIESLRDLKKGGVKETLDIQISDSAGIRPYEMFSGGEAFRIDFALRIAISKLLARRAGTALQTLIIDEGFGSQDEEGLARIMQSLYAIQEDFSKIIVVSHLSEFKENFPVHFIIEKNSMGSIVTVEERG